MKKILALLLLLSLCFCLFSCQAEDSDNPVGEQPNESGGSDESEKDENACKKHKYGNWEIVTYPSEEEWGLNKRTCQNCDDTEEKLIPYGPYSAGLVYASNGNGTCSVERFGFCDDEQVVIPPTNEKGEPVTNIREWAFYGCYSMKSIVLPDSLTAIGPGAFYACSISTIDLPEGLTFIGNSAFYDCRSLNAIVMPKSIETIGYNAFDGCRRLSRVFYSGTKEDWAKVTIHTENDVLYRSGLIVYMTEETSK